MSDGNKKVKITADLIGRTLHNLDELGVVYALVIEGVPAMFSNSTPLHAAAIIYRQHQRNEKLAEEMINSEAEKMIDRSLWPRPGDLE